MNLVHLLTAFEGRIDRARFWTGFCILTVASLALGAGASLADGMLGLRIGRAGPVGFLTLAAIALTAYAYFALQTKRWHDRDKSGWWNLLLAVPVIGFVWTLVEAGMLAGTRGPNQYGPDPLV